MNTYLTRKHLLPIAATLVCLAPLASQNAQASTTFSSYATVTYTIESLNNLANPGNFSGLGITGSFGLVPGQDFQVKTGNALATATLSDAGTISLVPAIGSSYSRTFQLDGTADNGGYVTASNLANLSLAFNSTSTDSYDIGLTLSYQLSAGTSGNDASTEISLNYYNEDESFSNLNTPDYASAPANILVPDYLSKTHDFNFILASGGSQTLYVDAGITGTLQASPVPLPSAIWLFASALLAIPGIKKSKRMV